MTGTHVTKNCKKQNNNIIVIKKVKLLHPNNYLRQVCNEYYTNKEVIGREIITMSSGNNWEYSPIKSNKNEKEKQIGF